MYIGGTTQQGFEEQERMHALVKEVVPQVVLEHIEYCKPVLNWPAENILHVPETAAEIFGMSRIHVAAQNRRRREMGNRYRCGPAKDQK